jgi:hypothetical protein
MTSARRATCAWSRISSGPPFRLPLAATLRLGDRPDDVPRRTPSGPPTPPPTEQGQQQLETLARPLRLQSTPVTDVEIERIRGFAIMDGDGA